jgi:drug/metabolite transporter (DMT)-like permease
MSVIAPVTAVTAAAVPVLVGLLGGDTIGPWAAAGIALALAAVVLVSADGGLSALRSARPASVAPALAAGAAFGFFFVLLDRTSQDSGLTPLVTARLASVALVVVIALAGRRSLRVGRTALPLVALSGVGDMTANALFLLATQADGQLAITGVLASLYPVSTVILAQVVLRERLAGAQVAGLGTAVAAVVLITLPG